jgi:dolichol-phosphate mannosyltransferase
MIYFLVPIYNESANIPNLANELLAIHLDDSVHFVFSDDGSLDQSVAEIHKLFRNTQYTVLGDGVNRGPGYAFNQGFKWILEKANKTDCVVTIEADCTSDLSLLPVMLSLNKHGYDMVLASVYAQGGGFDNTSFLRLTASSLANLIFRFLFGIRVLTLSSFYRVYTITILAKINAQHGELIRESGFISMLEILVNALKAEARVIEVPMRLHSGKRNGKSKMKVFRTTIDYFRFLVIRKFRS